MIFCLQYNPFSATKSSVLLTPDTSKPNLIASVNDAFILSVTKDYFSKLDANAMETCTHSVVKTVD